MITKNKVFIIIPAYNEEKVVGSVIDSIKKEGWRNIIVVDDGSNDGTLEIAKKHKVIALRHIINLGQGASLQTGFEYFLRKTKGELVVTFDADGQFDPKEIKRAVNFLLKNKLDVVLGSRFLGKAVNLPLAKKIILKLGIFFTRVFSGVRLTDTHNGFRVLTRKALEKIKLNQNGMAHASEIIHQIISNDFRFDEFPVTVYYDRYHKIKGQKLTNSFRIVFDLIFDRIFK
ncbi:MAG: glycosyltransferase family 2 protein [Patescibacteria group bacterium]|nr:glycosyltransferase family 2 protein [Patescibacteria group bacterium]